MESAKLLFVPKGPIYRDDADKLRSESRNGVLQAEFVLHAAGSWTPETLLTVDVVKEAQRLAITQIYRCAGCFRDGPVALKGDQVEHQPPEHQEVPDLVAEMCAYVNHNWDEKTPVHLASYVMWRLNWIHPFFGGNGRTARAISYLVLCARLGFVIPGEMTIPEQIVNDRTPYYAALRVADAAAANGRIDVGKMEELMSSLLAKQLVEIHESATGIICQSDEGTSGATDTKGQ